MNQRQIIILLSTGAALAIAGQGWAQTTAEQGATPPTATTARPSPKASGSPSVEEIVVTAQRSATNLQKTPVAVSAFSGQTLLDRGATSLRDVAAMTPNLTVGNRDGLGNTEGGFAIRGIGVSASESSPGVGIYVDDVYYASRFGSILGLFDTDRIEVLRGPQGTLFGRNTIAGAVQYITPTPGKDFGGYVTGTSGSEGRNDLEGVINVPIGDTLSARVALGSFEENGYVRDDTTHQERGSEYTKQARIRLHWTPIQRLSVDFNLQAVDYKNNGRAGVVIAANSAIGPNGGSLSNAAFFCCHVSPPSSADISQKDYNNPGFNSPDFGDVSFTQGSGTIAYNITDNIKLKSISAYAVTRDTSATDFDNTPQPIIAVHQGLDYTKLFTEELQLQGSSFGNRLKWTIGSFYFDDTDNFSGQLETIGLLPAFPGGNIDNKDQATSLYGQATYNFNEKLSITAGVRESHEETSGQVVSPLLAKQSASFDDTSPTIGLNYQATDDVFVYAKASKGFRAGGIVVSPLLPKPFSLPYNPETAWTYESGIRSTLLDHRVRLNLTGFYTDWSNIQFNYTDFAGAGPVPSVLNAGNANIYGAELETQFVVTRNFNLWGTLSTLNGHYTKIDAAGASLVTLDTPLARAPRLKYAFGGAYTYRLPNDSTLVTNLDYSWTDDQRSSTSISDNINMPSFGLLNGRLEYRPPNKIWSIALYGTNLTNKYYYTGGIDLLAQSGVEFAELGRPRQYGATLRYNF